MYICPHCKILKIMGHAHPCPADVDEIEAQAKVAYLRKWNEDNLERIIREARE